ncbi:sensor histidine kinase [uncultured Nostoc sp.]|uniref:sensor histidine kinase n=1 Tax=uncultured Nostoc sp. TaxID=340711 RepID=UPI0035CBF154
MNVSPNLPPLVSDLASLTEIVSELLNNACKYTPPDGQITVDVQVIDTAKSLINEDTESGALHNLQVPYFQITISNTGAIIPKQEQSRIFEAFYRIPQSDRWQQSGTGLGLALVKKLVQYLQGTIKVTSYQSWTRFTVQLPLSL